MKAGKLSESALKRSVLKQLHTSGTSVIQGPEIGADYSAVEIEPGQSVVSAVATRCFGGELAPMLSVYAALNNLCCSGAKPIGIQVNLLIPTTSGENDLREWVKAIDAVCESERIAVLGGHTEVVRSVSEPIVTVTALGTVEKAQQVGVGNVLPGMDILITKRIALEGTAVLATQYEKELLERYAGPFVERAKHFIDYLSIQSEAAVATKSGVAAMHDISEGGVFGALWEMGLSSGVGLEIDLKKIPIRQETVEICEFFDVNPYKLTSAGSVLMAANDGNALVHAICQAGGEAVIVGKATAGNDRVLINGEERRFLEMTQTDELWRIKSRRLL